MFQLSDAAYSRTATYKDGTTETYGEFLVKFERRTKYVMGLEGIKDEDVKSIVYVNHDIASLTFITGKKTFLFLR